MTDLTRRKFLTKASLGVAAGVAATAGLSQLADAAGLAKPARSAAVPKAAASRAAAPAELDMTPLGDNMIAHVRDVAKGEVAVLVGNREIVYRDRQLVGRLLQGARQAEKEA